jgi:hypothetical protein
VRTLPKKKSDKQKLIINAVYDYFGKSQNEKRAVQIALFIMGRKRGVELTKEELSDVWAIKENLNDKTYTETLPFLYEFFAISSPV